MTTKTFSLAEAQAELSALKSELASKRESVASLKAEQGNHQASLVTLQKQRDGFALQVGMCHEGVKGAQASLARNRNRPNEKFVQDALDVAIVAEKDATSLLEAFDLVGAIKLAEGLVRDAEGKLKVADLDLSKMSRKASEMQDRFVAAFAAEGQARLTAAQAKLQPLSDHLAAEDATLRELSEHLQAEQEQVKSLRVQRDKLVQHALNDLSDWPEYAQKLASSYSTSSDMAARAVLTSFLGLMNTLEEVGTEFRKIDGRAWWDMMALMRLEWGTSFADEIPQQASAIREYLASLK